MREIELSDALVDEHLDKILLAAGSSLKHYSMPKTIKDMQSKMRDYAEAAVLAERRRLAELIAEEESYLFDKHAKSPDFFGLNFSDCIAIIYGNYVRQENKPEVIFCKKCGYEMSKGIAIKQAATGIPDFPGSDEVVTLSPGGPSKLIDCIKCKECGWSFEAGGGEA